MTAHPVLKHQPADFLVRENMVVRLAEDPAGAPQHYFTLRKCGYTTMEAVRLVAARLGISGREVTYGGLKDEDGITEQLIAVPAGAVGDPDRPIERVAEDGRWLHLQHYGHGDEPLRIGRLEGNGFRLVVRNLDAATAECLAELRKLQVLFLNYYDTQRFGVPGGPKRTHLVGAAILAGDWDRALHELVGLNAPESPDARAWTGPAADWFTALDPRTTSFYLAAHASGRWNAQLAELVSGVAGDHACDRQVDGLDYRYVRSLDAAVAVLAAARELPYDRYTFEDGAPVARSSKRSTVVQTTVGIDGHRPDEHHPGAHQLTLTFFLPSGCYATAAVRQLFALDLLGAAGG